MEAIYEQLKLTGREWEYATNQLIKSELDQPAVVEMAKNWMVLADLIITFIRKIIDWLFPQFVRSEGEL
ncbi:hypothetical protein R3398_17560 [Rossellomorea marisflavi]|uniref:hypothetical protein n=1 Tax=Rossellomorea marisflavi TaxID=189381 RepID=UPI0006FEC260|nr:hypothetical protein [Rossellomorea marisflavi]KQU57631.1 hypothetical protein ASG66_17945 [Bacillus sp. Leaf406]MDW4528177.1 hypothetical protein [Rossellomorea marisflavi]WJV19562.1 hypothetical protein QU593_03520 [Rossellomorea marisflavi]